MVNRELPFVIGAGMGRTGTLSLYTALNQLGYKTFHMKEIFRNGAGADFFDLAEASQDAGGNSKDVDRLAVRTAQGVINLGYNATTDFPASLLYQELMELVPEAKVILSVRTDGDAWSKSVMSTIGQMGIATSRAPFRFAPFFRQFEKLDRWIWREIGIATAYPRQQLDKGALAKAHDTWNESVIKAVPKERLLIHQSRDGFPPICKHLGIPDTECPKEYPHVNDSASFEAVLVVLQGISVTFWAVLIGGIFFLLRKLMFKNLKNKSE